MVNGHAKRYLKNKFSTWYGNQISKQLDEVVNIDAVNVKLRLTALKPLHAHWIVDFYNEMTTVKRKPIIESGWRAAGITDAIRIGSKNLPAIDPFQEIDPFPADTDVFRTSLGRLKKVTTSYDQTRRR